LEDTCFTEPSIERGMSMAEIVGDPEVVITKQERLHVEEELRKIADEIQALQIEHQRCLQKLVKIARKLGIEVE